jgi:hypothetical protein
MCNFAVYPHNSARRSYAADFQLQKYSIPDWQNQILTYFPLISELTTPWRWINADNEELGEWVLFCRGQLSSRQSIDLNNSPPSVKWLNLTGNPQSDLQLKSRAQYNIRNNQRGDSLLVIGDSMRSALRHQFASQNIGIDVVEPVDLRDLVAFADCLDTQTREVLLTSLLNTFSNLATGMGVSTWSTRMRSILSNTHRRAPSALEAALADYVTTKEIEKLKKLLTEIQVSSDVRVYRVAAFKAFAYAVDLVLSDQNLTLKKAMELTRERTRHRGDGRVPHTAIGSTLLLKGLETDHCLILDAQHMNQQNLYVALSRGAKSVTVGSRTNLLL